MSGYVFDASLAVKWALPAKGEPYAEESNWLVQEFGGGSLHLVVPDLLLGRDRQYFVEAVSGWQDR